LSLPAAGAVKYITAMETIVLPLEAGASFNFDCHPKVPCFNACCGNLSQVLTPYDIICLKNHLGCSSGQFLERYAMVYSGPATGLPVASLRFDRRRGGLCPFVGPEGCTVYPARPGSCRLYPLARGAALDPGGKPREHWALIKEPHCRGHESSRTRTIDQWIRDQGLEDYLEFNDLLLEIISLRNKSGGRPLAGDRRRSFVTAAYDLDRFRAQVLDGTRNCGPEVAEKVAAAGASDTDCLKVALRWLRREMGGLHHGS